MPTKIIIYILSVCFLNTGCKKYLDVTPNDALSIPSTLEDYKAMLENTRVMNVNMMPFSPAISTDESYLDLQEWESAGETNRYAYIWAEKIPDPLYSQWAYPYRGVLYCNLVLEGLEKLERNADNMVEYDQLKGSALFYRSFYLYALQEMYGQPYRPASAERDLGIPLRLSSDFSVATSRATVAETFERILSDLHESAQLLLEQIPFANRNRPSKPAAFAMLSRVYLTIQQYGKAGEFADSCLQRYDKLVDYNTLNPAAYLPFLSYADSNEEVLFGASMINISYPARFPTDTTFYHSYDEDDLRKTVLFRIGPVSGRPEFKGNYTGLFNGFAGLATDEVYLNRAEARAREGALEQAMADVNRIREKRWRRSTVYEPVTATNAEDALRMVLEERKKELLFRGTRWTDLRRLNQDSRFAITLTRKLGTETYTILPESPRYTFPIPEGVLALTGIADNPR